MYHYDTLIFIKMRMSVDIRRCTMRCPTGMTDSKLTRKQLASMSQFIQHFQPSHCFFHIDFLSVINCNTGRVISSVLQLLQSLKQDWRCLTLSYITYNSTHNECSPFKFYTPCCFTIYTKGGYNIPHPPLMF